MAAAILAGPGLFALGSVNTGGEVWAQVVKKMAGVNTAAYRLSIARASAGGVFQPASSFLEYRYQAPCHGRVEEYAVLDPSLPRETRHESGNRTLLRTEWLNPIGAEEVERTTLSKSTGKFSIVRRFPPPDRSLAASEQEIWQRLIALDSDRVGLLHSPRVVLATDRMVFMSRHHADRIHRRERSGYPPFKPIW